ncbi:MULTISPECIES: response regulator [Idiomarina]|jgi:two-component system sensor histidine kinase/response regulator|uniref:Sensory/regulatory protein RpfC n=3 Tax=Idiomarina abyssalis TaxID=86102 RepID=A0A8I1G7E2_9GAMM|nr:MULTISPECIES: response regulator [Idiomarina]MAO69304.1 hybrid sensor histidine kinase/response regulator [Idiomarina sp.]MBF80622.1 hybrid sensor histidine kinase/response regulator [Idiomarina sp.]MBJ7267196.1 response regulator [Idiomarina abyssalis]MBJ7273643.1 response regulator [Idiomarina abyssalis]MBJ7315531.1 response regulator [Idiomarina abyssalis]|tara:strand:- start:3646 stop:6246 length:2601 start_codon:yes stop_codon:yes gene_type:complete
MNSFWTFLQLIFVILQVTSLALYALLPAPWSDTVLVAMILFSLIIGVVIWWWSRRNALTAPFRQPFLSSDSLQLFEQVFNDLPTRVYWRDPQLKLLGGNRAFANDFGVAPESLTGKSDAEIESLAANDVLLERDKKTFSQKAPSVNAEIELKVDNKSQWVEHSSVPLYDDDHNIIGILGSYYDISGIKSVAEEMEKAKETAERANQSKGEFLANMSHEIRTPINAIVGMANLCLKTELNQKQKRYIKVIDSSSQALLGVINDILDFSKIDAGKLTVERIPFDLQDVLTSLADMFAYRAYDKDLEFIINLPANIPTRLIGDPLRLNQVLVNLISNAIKFTEDGEINVAVNLLDSSKDNVLLRISVTDTGIGMDEEQRANLFKAFTQADTSTTRKYGGTGLGLAISRRLILLMGGDIGVTSAAGQGSTFYIEVELPLQKEQDNSHHQYLLQKLSGVRILAIDDNLSTREMLYEMLRSYQVDVKVCRTAEQALQVFQQSVEEDNPYQLVLVDWRLPGMDGLEFCQTITERYADDVRPKLTLATGYYAEELSEKAKQAGVNDIISKPFTASTLGRSLASTLFQRELPDENDAESGDGIPESILRAPILVVEDNEINQQVAREILTSHKFKVDIVENGQLAVEAVHNKNYSLVLMDIQMPVMDGLKAARTIRADFNYQQLPILAMTANAMSGDEERSLAAGMQGHIAKPIDEQQLIKAIIKWAVPGDYTNNQQPEAPAATEEDEPAKPPVRIPQVKGIEFEAALKRLQYNVELYLKLVEQLYETYQGSATKVSDFITRGQHDSARRYFHSLKGAAANLGFTQLQNKAADLEQFMAEGNIDKVADQITELEKRLRYAHQAAVDLEAIQQHQS